MRPNPSTLSYTVTSSGAQYSVAVPAEVTTATLYVQMLIESIPVPDPNQKWDTNVTLPSEEELRSQVDAGCRFYPRCPYRMDRCLIKQPPLFQIDSGEHQAACYLYDGTPAGPGVIENQAATKAE